MLDLTVQNVTKFTQQLIWLPRFIFQTTVKKTSSQKWILVKFFLGHNEHFRTSLMKEKVVSEKRVIYNYDDALHIMRKARVFVSKHQHHHSSSQLKICTDNYSNIHSNGQLVGVRSSSRSFMQNTESWKGMNTGMHNYHNQVHLYSLSSMAHDCDLNWSLIIISSKTMKFFTSSCRITMTSLLPNLSWQ